MLLLCFKIDDDSFVIDTTDIIEVTPLVDLKSLPGTDPSVLGLMNYHGTSVPVIDINGLCGKAPCRHSLTTRVILVRYHDKTLGLVTEAVTETLRIDEQRFMEAGIDVYEKPFLGKVAEHGSMFVQLVNTGQLLSAELQQALFPEQAVVNG